MLTYCLKCRKNTESKNSKFVRTKSRRIMLLSKCEVWANKKLKFVKEQEAGVLLSSLGIHRSLNEIPLLGALCFKSIQQINTRYKMDEVVKKFLLAGDIFMPEMHLKQPGFTYSACGPFA